MNGGIKMSKFQLGLFIGLVTGLLLWVDVIVMQALTVATGVQALIDGSVFMIITLYIGLGFTALAIGAIDMGE